MDYSEFVDINEINENLEKLENSLLNIETSCKSDNSDAQDIHVSFRYAHNLKSLLSMFGKEKCSRLIHSIESNFDLIRKGKASISNELTHNCLLALDLIKLSLNEKTEDDAAFDRIIEMLDAISILKPVETTNKIGNIQLTAHEMEKLSGLSNDGYNIFLLEKMIGTKLDREDFISLPIFADIEETGILIAFSPKHEELSGEADECLLNILFAARLGEQELEYLIFDPFKLIVSGTEKEKEKQSAAKNIYSRPYLRSLILEEDFFDRRQLSSVLQEYGECDIAFDPLEIIMAVGDSLKGNHYYDLIFIGLKSDNARYSLIREIRSIEEKANIMGLAGSKIVAVTDDLESGNIIDLYKSYCDMHIKRLADKQYLADRVKSIINGF